MKDIIFSIGWDVGGWLSSNNAFCLVISEAGEVTWISQPVVLKATDLPLIHDLDKLVEGILDRQPEGGPQIPPHLLRDFSVYSAGIRTVVAIDAPLGFSKEYQRLVNQSGGLFLEPRIESFPKQNFRQEKGKSNFKNNVYGFRETERFVEASIGKRPLSAPFDFLGNNATLAINARLVWEQQGFKTNPFVSFDPKNNKAIIEVYPGIFTVPRPGYQEVLSAIQRTYGRFYPMKRKGGDLVPSKVDLGFTYYFDEMVKKEEKSSGKRKNPKTDECDALICAFLGQGLWPDEPVYSLNTRIPEDLDSAAKMEGWIYLLEEK